MSTSWPQVLQSVPGPFPRERLQGAADGMGTHGTASRSLAAAGLVPPDLITGMTLWLLARQPRQPRAADYATPPARASAIAGGVWVREQFTIHAPLPAAARFTVSGAGTGRYVHKQRRYSTTRSSTHDAGGQLLATNLSTGLVSYRPEPGLADTVEGLRLAATPAPLPDYAAAAGNPHAARLRELRVGDTLGGQPLQITLAMMAARDTSNPDNPIHSDPEQARRAGLDKPIAGGSHVLAFVLEPIMAALGSHCLLHGANFDIRWKAPTKADAWISPRATVAAADSSAITFDLDVQLRDGPTAMVGRLVVPLPQ